MAETVYGGGRIRDIDGYVHVIDGKILCFGRHVFNLSSGFAQALLFKIVDDMDEREIRVIERTGPGLKDCRIFDRRLDELPAAVQDVIRRIGAGMA